MKGKLTGLQRLLALLTDLLPSPKSPSISPFELPYLKPRVCRNMPYLPERIVYAWRAEKVAQNAEDKKWLKENAKNGVQLPDEIALTLRLKVSEMDYNLSMSLPEGIPFSEASDTLSKRASETLANRLTRLDKKRRCSKQPEDDEKGWTRPIFGNTLVIDAARMDRSLKDTLIEESCLYLSQSETKEKIPYSIRWLQYPLDNVSVPFLPREDFPITPYVDTRKGSLDRVFVASHEPLSSYSQGFRTFWFTSENAKQLKTEDISWIETEDGPLPHLTDADFRCEAPLFTPTQADVGKYVCVATSCLPVATVGDSMTPSICPEMTVAAKSEAAVVGRSEEEELLATSKMQWAMQDRKRQSAENDESRVRIVSYNLLSDTYINLNIKDLFYPYCDRMYQHMRYRYSSLLKELQAYSADVYFLQEVCPRMGYHYLPALFKHSNHGFLFHRKYAEVREGSGLAWNLERFSKEASWCRWLTDALAEEYNQDIRTLLSLASAEDRAFFEGRPTLLHMVQLVDKRSDSVLLVANTHLHHDPRHEHLKALQTALVTRELARHVREAGPTRRVRVLLGADLNSTPDSAAVALLARGWIAASDGVWAADESMGGIELRLPEELRDLRNLSGTPEYTNYTVHKDAQGENTGFAGCIDYVWASGLETIQVAPQPSIEEMTRQTALPSSVAPSDHLSLVLSARYTE